ncbi:MAG: T9SS type A sorting domain-containing protein [Bacteroidetes bacterium]|nr:T9SS type A sorting domain-containing protein [Bacteroidota bacterium]
MNISKYIPFVLLLMGAPLHASSDGAASDIVLDRFSAARFRDMITLNWSTAGERNNFGFEVERRSQFDTKWRTVAYVRGMGLGDTSGQRYSFTDKVQENTILFYRLRQIDVFGKTRVTPAVSVTPEHFDASIRLRAITRTTHIQYNQISLALPNEGLVRMRLFDAFGRELEAFGNTQRLPAGFHVIPFRSASLQAGVYSVRLETDDGTLVETMLKTS